MPETPSKIIFIHTPKSAGISLTRYLWRALDERKLGATVLLHDHRGMPGETREQALEKARHARYVHGHLSWATASELAGDQSSYMFTVLRNPRDRIRSLYFFMQNLPDIPAFKDDHYVKGMSPTEFLRAGDQRIRYLIDNYQVRQLQGRLDAYPSDQSPGAAMLERAVETLTKLSYVAFVDTYDDDFRSIVSELGFPLMGKPVPKDNVTKVKDVREHELGERTAAFMQALDRDAPDVIRWDLEFYDSAKRMFLPRQSPPPIAPPPGRPSWLRLFRKT